MFLIDLLRDCGWTWSGTDVCSSCYRCWILVWEETLSCDRWDEWTFLFAKVCKKIRDVRWYTLLRNLNMWIWFRDDCLRPGCDRLASSVQLAVDQQDHCWILSLGNVFYDMFKYISIISSNLHCLFSAPCLVWPWDLCQSQSVTASTASQKWKRKTRRLSR